MIAVNAGDMTAKAATEATGIDGDSPYWFRRLRDNDT